MKVCQKAIDRIEKLRKEELNFKDCIKYHICPKCGSDLILRRNTGGILFLGIHLECEECDFFRIE